MPKNPSKISTVNMNEDPIENAHNSFINNIIVDTLTRENELILNGKNDLSIKQKYKDALNDFLEHKPLSKENEKLLKYTQLSDNVCIELHKIQKTAQDVLNSNSMVNFQAMKDNKVAITTSLTTTINTTISDLYRNIEEGKRKKFKVKTIITFNYNVSPKYNFDEDAFKQAISSGLDAKEEVKNQNNVNQQGEAPEVKKEVKVDQEWVGQDHTTVEGLMGLYFDEMSAYPALWNELLKYATDEIEHTEENIKDKVEWAITNSQYKDKISDDDKGEIIGDLKLVQEITLGRGEGRVPLNLEGNYAPPYYRLLVKDVCSDLLAGKIKPNANQNLVKEAPEQANENVVPKENDWQQEALLADLAKEQRRQEKEQRRQENEQRCKEKVEALKSDPFDSFSNEEKILIYSLPVNDDGNIKLYDYLEYKENSDNDYKSLHDIAVKQVYQMGFAELVTDYTKVLQPDNNFSEVVKSMIRRTKATIRGLLSENKSIVPPEGLVLTEEEIKAIKDEKIRQTHPMYSNRLFDMIVKFKNSLFPEPITDCYRPGPDCLIVPCFLDSPHASAAIKLLFRNGNCVIKLDNDNNPIFENDYVINDKNVASKNNPIERVYSPDLLDLM